VILALVIIYHCVIRRIIACCCRLSGFNSQTKVRPGACSPFRVPFLLPPNLDFDSQRDRRAGEHPTSAVAAVSAVGHGISRSPSGRRPFIGIFSKMIARTCDVIDLSVAISCYEQICDSVLITALRQSLVQHSYAPCLKSSDPVINTRNRGHTFLEGS
jgi:hypothetical protein